MPKKADGSLTGGTGDVNPQFYRLTCPPVAITIPSAGSAAASSTQQFPVPVPKYPTTQGNAIVMELLKVRWRNNIGFNVNSTGGQVIQSTGYISTKAPPNVGGSAPPFPTPNDSSIVDVNQGTLTYQFFNASSYIATFRYGGVRARRLRLSAF